MTGIYGIYNAESGKWYVGQAMNIEKRWNDHKSFLNRGIHKNKHLQNSWNKRGPDAFEFHILELCSAGELNDREAVWIAEKDSHSSGYNKTDGGEGLKGWTAPDWYRKQRSEMYSGEKNPFYGKKHTEETRAKLRETHAGPRHVNFGKHLSEKTRAKISAKHKGMKHSDETRRKLSEHNKGKPPSEVCLQRAAEFAMSADNPLCRAVRCRDTGIVYHSAAEAARQTGRDRSKISACCRGDRKSTKGTHWEYA